MAGRIVGTGHFLPDQVLDNAALASTIGRDDQWILQRTGIRERRIAPPDAGTAALAVAAALSALEDAGRTSADADVIIVATSTPDYLTPPTACEVQAALGASGAAAFDIEAGFAGWIYALLVADALIAAGTVRTALVIGAEKLSTVTDRSDEATAPLFGDGAGAVVLAAGDNGWGVGARSWWADGRLADALRRPGGGAREPFDRTVLDERRHLLRMEGTRLFRQAVRTMAAQARAVLEGVGLGVDAIDLIIPHQANLRILHAFAEELAIPLDRVFVHIERYGNTGSATVPIALDEALRSGAADEASRILLVSFGAGATAGAVL
ncbi:MAG TPA: beta-ketoacyl-ACP synthase 3, partial [Longimicrobiales bacterium]|nr:beta-ketoacyl-ACP synthase 3 [Longimicrobiales bacterium]